MVRVKVTFERGEQGERVIIRKDGGFSTHDVESITNLVEDLFGEGGAEESSKDDKELEEQGDENTEIDEEGSDEDKSFQDRVKREAAAAASKTKQEQVTPPSNRGQVQTRVAEGVGITKGGTVDRRTLRGSPESPDPKQQKVAKQVASESRPEQ